MENVKKSFPAQRLSVFFFVTVFTVNTQHSTPLSCWSKCHKYTLSWFAFLTLEWWASGAVIYDKKREAFQWKNLCQNRLKTIKLSDWLCTANGKAQKKIFPLFTFDSAWCLLPRLFCFCLSRYQSIKLQLYFEKCQFIVKLSMEKYPPRHNLIIAWCAFEHFTQKLSQSTTKAFKGRQQFNSTVNRTKIVNFSMNFPRNNKKKRKRAQFRNLICLILGAKSGVEMSGTRVWFQHWKGEPNAE